MAQSSDLESRVCVVWKTERPFADRSRTSSNFTLLGFKWNLHMRYVYVHPTGPHYRIFLKRETGSPRQEEIVGYSFRLTTFVEDSLHFGCPVLFRVTDIRTTNELIWDFKEEMVSKHMSGFKIFGEWKVVCLFHEVPLSTFWTENEAIYSSAQADQLSSVHDPNRLTGSLSTDKCVQTTIDVPPHLETLSFDFYNLVKRKMFPDVTLKCGDGTLPAHRSILATRSEVFDAMFRNETVESATGVVDITDFDVPVLDLLLKYVYSGKIPDLTDDTASGLFAVADKYAMEALKKACSEWMIRNLNRENCVNFLIIADMHNDETFKEAAISFITHHHGVLTTQTWVRFSETPSQLSNEVYHRFVTTAYKKGTEDGERGCERWSSFSF